MAIFSKLKGWRTLNFYTLAIVLAQASEFFHQMDRILGSGGSEAITIVSLAGIILRIITNTSLGNRADEDLILEALPEDDLIPKAERP